MPLNFRNLFNSWLNNEKVLQYLKEILLSIQYNPRLMSVPCYISALYLTWRVRFNSFFYDTIQLASEHAHYFYENGFSSLLLPDGMDSGHPPTFGIYLALMWKILGKTLTISHLVMLPFLAGIIWQVWRLGQRLLGDLGAAFLLPFILLDPALAGQAVLVSPDIVLAFFFLLAVNEIFAKQPPSVVSQETRVFEPRQPYLLSLAILGLCMISLRGMMVAFALFLFDFSFFFKNKNKRFSGFHTLTLPYLLGFLSAVSFLIYHYYQKGWVGYHAASPWDVAFQRVDFQGFIKNIATLGWRLIDFGHIFLWLLTFVLTLKYKGYRYFRQTRALWVLILILLTVLSLTQVFYKGLLMHRYFLPVYIILDFLCLKTLSDLKGWRLQLILYACVLTAQISGNFWVYPQPIATGWDTTLAHLPYYRLRNEMIQYIDSQGISCDSIGSAFPNQRYFKHIDLNEKQGRFKEYDLNKNAYIFYSNVMNDFSKQDLETLKTLWKIEKQLRGGQVEVILYKRGE